MALEVGTHISDLVQTNPVSTDGLGQADDHIRLIKKTIQNTFPNITGPVLSTQAELNKIDGVTATTAELNSLTGYSGGVADLNKLVGVTASAVELNKLDGVTASAAEINKLAGVTASTVEINKLSGVTASAAEISKLAGLTATTAELNALGGLTATAADLNYTTALRATGVTATEYDRLDGVTSGIQAQLNAKAPLESPAFTGTVGIGANWTVTQSGTSLKFAFDGVNRMKLDSIGNLTVEGNVTAFGSA